MHHLSTTSLSKISYQNQSEFRINRYFDYGKPLNHVQKDYLFVQMYSLQGLTEQSMNHLIITSEGYFSFADEGMM